MYTQIKWLNQKDNEIIWIKRGEGFNQGKDEFPVFLILVEAGRRSFAGRKLQVKLELQNSSDNAKPVY